MLMNLDMLRSKGDLFDAAMEWFSRKGHFAFAADNDFIRAYFRGSTKIIDDKFNTRYNITRPEIFSQDTDGRIIHTAQKLMKVWEMTGLPVQRLYWKYYLRSAWGENITPEELADKLCTVCETSHVALAPFIHLNPHPCFKQTLIAVPRKIFWNNNLVRSLRLIVTDIYYRLKYKLTRR